MRHSVVTRNDMAVKMRDRIGTTGVRVVLRASNDAVIATLTGGTSSSTGPTVTIPTASLTDDSSAVGGTLDHMIVEPLATGEIFRYDDVTVLGFSVNQVIDAGDVVDCTGDVTWTAPL